MFPSFKLESNYVTHTKETHQSTTLRWILHIEMDITLKSFFKNYKSVIRQGFCARRSNEKILWQQSLLLRFMSI